MKTPESFSIDAGLRVRMEGGVELLEDALPLLDSVKRAVLRPHPTTDDVTTLREASVQWPRIEAALTRVRREPSAEPLVSRVDTAMKEVTDAVHERTGEQPASPAVTLSMATSLVRNSDISPAPTETRLVHANTVRGDLGFSVVAVALIIAVFSTHLWLLLVPLAVLTGWYGWRRRSAPLRWVLLPDRLHIAGRNYAPVKTRVVETSENTLTLEAEDSTHVLYTDMAEQFATYLRALRTPLLQNLESRPTTHRIIDGQDDLTIRGPALVMARGVLFVPRDATEAVIDLFARLDLPSLLLLLAHVPENDWAALSQHLERAGAVWFSQATTARVDEANNSLSILLRDDRGRTVRLQRRAEISPLLRDWRHAT